MNDFSREPRRVFEGLLNVGNLEVRMVRHDLLARGTVRNLRDDDDTGMRMPRMQARPPRIAGSNVMRSKWVTAST